MSRTTFIQTLGILSCIFSTAAFAVQGHFYLGGMLDNSIAIIGSKNPVIRYSSGATITDGYAPFERSHSALLLNLNGGYEWSGANWRPGIAVGLGVYRTLSDYNVTGQLTESAPGNLNPLYDYQYNLKQWIAMAQIKLTWTIFHFTPFINFGAGPSWDELANYHEAPIYSDGFTVYPPFAAHTNVNWAYEAGAGLGYEFNFTGGNSEFKHERVAIGYQHIDFGNIQFGKRNADYPYALGLGRLTTNNFYVSFVHLF